MFRKRTWMWMMAALMWLVLLAPEAALGQRVCRVQPHIISPQFDQAVVVRPNFERPQFERSPIIYPIILRPVTIIPEVIPPDIEDPTFNWCPTTNGIPVEMTAALQMFSAMYGNGKYRPNPATAGTILKELRKTGQPTASLEVREPIDSGCCGDPIPGSETTGTAQPARRFIRTEELFVPQAHAGEFRPAANRQSTRGLMATLRAAGIPESRIQEAVTIGTRQGSKHR